MMILMTTLVPIIRKQYDVMVEGKKSRGKSFFLAVNGFLEGLNGTSIFSNMPLNPEYMDYYFIEDLDDIHSMSNGVFIADDFERVMSSKWMSSKSKQAIADVLLDLGKASVSLWATGKRFEEMDKSIRSQCDIFLSADIYLRNKPISYTDFLYKSNYLNYCYLGFYIYNNPDDDPVGFEVIDHLEIWKDLYSTIGKIRKLL